jgi:hypothetical protein
MDLAMPLPSDKPMPVDENRTMTILIGDHGKAKCYMGLFDQKNLKDINLRSSSLRHELLARKKDVLEYSASTGKNGKGIIVLIKPGKASNYGDLVNVLDEMAISDIPSYAIVDIDPKEENVFSL